MTIKVVKRSNDAIHDYAVYVIFSARNAIEITVDHGLKPWQVKPGINVPATGTLTGSEAALLAKGVEMSLDILNGKFLIGDSSFEFKPLSI